MTWFCPIVRRRRGSHRGDTGHAADRPRDADAPDDGGMDGGRRGAADGDGGRTAAGHVEIGHRRGHHATMTTSAPVDAEEEEEEEEDKKIETIRN